MKLLVVTPNTRDLCAFWRSVGPFQLINRQMKNHQITILPKDFQFAWDYVLGFDAVFIQRGCRDEDLIIMKIARNLGIPVWVDYDDYLLDLPPWNPHAGIYNNPRAQQNIAMILACADLITVTTQELKTQFSKVNPAVEIIPNAYPGEIFPYALPEPADRQDCLMWRGTNTHDGDVLSVFESWAKIQMPVHFMGSPPWVLINTMDPKKVVVHAHRDPLVYFQYIHHLKPKAMLFPLLDCVFNRSKSNIAWIEATHAGALCVAPDWEEWRNPGCINYDDKNPASFLQAVETVQQMSQDEVKERVSAARKLIIGEPFFTRLSLETQNQRRLSLLSNLKQTNDRDPNSHQLGIESLLTLKKKSV